MKTVECEIVEVYDAQGRPHNETGPASGLRALDGSGWVLQVWRREGVLHRMDGPAIVLPPPDVTPVVDGASVKPRLLVGGLCWYRGRQVPDHWVTSRPTAAEIRALGDDMDLRAAAIAYYGVREYIKDIKARLLDADMDGRDAARELYEVPGLPYRVLICTDGGTGRIYDIAVPATCKTCAQAGAALNGFPDHMLAEES